MNLTAVDWAIVAGYFLLSAGIGFAFTKKGGESLSEYFISGRQVPWWLAAAAWNGKGYHLALYYAGEGTGARLSMVSLTDAGVPEQHPDWASAPGQLSDMHLVAEGKSIFAYYRGGSGGDRLVLTDVTKIGQWGSKTQGAKNLGALAATEAIAINAKGKPVRVKTAK